MDHVEKCPALCGVGDRRVPAEALYEMFTFSLTDIEVPVLEPEGDNFTQQTNNQPPQDKQKRFLKKRNKNGIVRVEE